MRMRVCRGNRPSRGSRSSSLSEPSSTKEELGETDTPLGTSESLLASKCRRPASRARIRRLPVSVPELLRLEKELLRLEPEGPPLRKSVVDMDDRLEKDHFCRSVNAAPRGGDAPPRRAFRLRGRGDPSSQGAQGLERL